MLVPLPLLLTVSFDRVKDVILPRVDQRANRMTDSKLGNSFIENDVLSLGKRIHYPSLVRQGGATGASEFECLL